MRGSLAGPRVLLRRLREIMAEPISAQDRLDKIVAQIASNMVAEVCSVYVLRADDVLELYATEGLKREAVHHAGLKVGQGLVGLIAADARPLNLPNAQSHPAFAYLPETGEEIYNAFLGVPILRAGRTLGVLTVQNRAHRTYFDEEVEALQTTAMVLAEMIAVGELEGLARPGTSLDVKRPISIRGSALSEGIALGHVVLHEPRVVVTALIAEDAEKERLRLEEAIAHLRLSVDDMLSRDDIALAGEHREILEAYRMFAYDRGWARRMDEAIQNGLSAEAAVEKVQSDTRARLLRQTDPYLRERLHDFDDLANRLLRELMGKGQGFDREGMPKDSIIVARNMGAAELLDYNRDRLRGLVLEEGGPTSHVTIVARALGIATIGRATNAVSLVENGDAIILDGDTGEAHIRPPADVEVSYGEKVRFRAKRQAQYRLLRNKPAVTRDGTRIALNMNAGLLVDLPHLTEAGAEGIGLCRTEHMFFDQRRIAVVREMILAETPAARADALARLLPMQRTDFASLFEIMSGLPVTVRLLDPPLHEFLPTGEAEIEELSLAMGIPPARIRARSEALAEANPMLGHRGVRLAISFPEIVEMQIRAILEAALDVGEASGRPVELEIMVPLVASKAELDLIYQRIRAAEAQVIRLHGRAPRYELGTMIELPRAALAAGDLARSASFFSFGTNDLTQTTFGISRDDAAPFLNAYLALGLMPVDPFATLDEAGVGELIRIATERGRAVRPGLKIGVCGEHGGDPASIRFFAGLDFDYVSCSPFRVPVARLAAAQAALAKAGVSAADLPAGATAPVG